MRRARNYVRDLNGNTFRDAEVIDYINEAIDRCAQVIPELRDIPYLVEKPDVLLLIPQRFQHIVSLYAGSKLQSQDERFHQAVTLMNEFEVKLAQLHDEVLAGETQILDAEGLRVTVAPIDEHVIDVYFEKSADDSDIDAGEEILDGNVGIDTIDGGSF
jgi:hypothetical protein